MKSSLCRGGATLAAALLSVHLSFYAAPSFAETLSYTLQKKHKAQQTRGTDLHPSIPTQLPNTLAFMEMNAARSSANSTLTPQIFVATAYCLRGRTASGRQVAKGLIAADRKVLPLGTRVRLDAGAYSGDYTVADTGSKIRGRKIDVWMPHAREAMRFGRRNVKLTVLQYGVRRRTVAAGRTSTPR